MMAMLRPYLTSRGLAIMALIGLASLAVAWAPVAGARASALTGLAIVTATVGLLATSALPGIAIAVIFFALALSFGAAPAGQLLAGFWANATLLIFGALIIGTAAERSGLGRAVARALIERFSGSYAMLLTGVLLGTFALSFLLPSTVGRLAITIPIVMAVVKEAGYAQGSNGYTGMMLTTVAGNFTTSYAIPPANLTNIIVLGTGEAVLGVTIPYLEYFLYCAPVLGLAKGVSFILLVLAMFPAPPPLRPERSEPVILSRAARRLSVVLAITVALWMTDVLHGLKAGWIAAGSALLCLLPPVALVRLRECFDLNRINATAIVPAVLGVASVLNHSGAGRLITEGILAVVPFEGRSPIFGFVAIALLSAAAAVVATITGAIAIITPVIADISAATRLPPKIGLIAEMVGLQAPLLHYEATPILVGMALARVSTATTTRFLVPLALIGLTVILGLEVAWLRLLGVLG